MKQTSQRSLLFRQNVNRTEEEWRRVCPRHGGRGMRTRLRPRRRAVDRPAIGNRHIIWQLTPCGKVAGDVGIVGLWKCGIMRLWDYGNGSRRFQFRNSVMVHLHKCTISQFRRGFPEEKPSAAADELRLGVAAAPCKFSTANASKIPSPR